MRRAVLLALPALLLPAAPGSAGSAQCVARQGVSVCPPAVSRCAAGDVLHVRAHGLGYGTVSCGGTTASCYGFRTVCSASAQTTSAGTVTCTATNAATAYCDVTFQAS